MNAVLTHYQKDDLLNRGFSRRTFGRIATMLSAGAALPFYNEPALAQLSRVEAPPDAVLINANENPLGPCKEAREAVQRMIQYGGRYRFGEADRVRTLLSEQEGLKINYVTIHAGSSGPLHQAVLAFCSPTRPFVTGDPGYEAGGHAANFIGAKAINVPLTKDYAHDVKAMAAASADAGLIYICNPNNPTGTLTPRSDIDWLVANKPKGAIVMIDEAYTHIAGVPFCTDLVAADKDVVILRTFSKIYGMAGLRAGAIMGRPDLLQKVNGFSQTMMPITGMAAASASLEAKYVVPERRKIIGDVRNDTFEFLDKHNFSFVRSVSNCFMVDVKRPGREIVNAMAQEKVYIGRVWPSWPNHVRVTVGTQDEMNKFKTAFVKVMA
ncbi:MAG TPA: pyridoxal phosphate-dependent aminotransferase [Bryobacteraceae bacterium]|nr:pyridoxal phosphate-dependent aminotransferase [Bryobacteraceae bacterium]